MRVVKVILLGLQVLILLFFLFWLFTQPNALTALIHLLTDDLYYPNYNYERFPVVFAVPILLWVYLIIFFITAFVYLINSLSRSVLSKHLIIRLVLKVTAITYIGLTLLQVISQNNFFVQMKLFFQDKTTQAKEEAIWEESYLAVFGPSYRFAKFCLKYLSGRYQGHLITDLNINEYLEPYLIKYYLYPAVDLITPSDTFDCLVVFNKQNPNAVVPSGFQVVGVFDKKSLLAIKK